MKLIDLFFLMNPEFAYNELIEPIRSNPNALEWYECLDEGQKIYLKNSCEQILGFKYDDLIQIISHEIIITVYYDILCQEAKP